MNKLILISLLMVYTSLTVKAQSSIGIYGKSKLSVDHGSEINITGDINYDADDIDDHYGIKLAEDGKLFIGGNIKVAEGDTLFPKANENRSEPDKEISDIKKAITFYGNKDSKLIGNVFIHSAIIDKEAGRNVYVEGKDHVNIGYTVGFKNGNFIFQKKTENGFDVYPQLILGEAPNEEENQDVDQGVVIDEDTDHRFKGDGESQIINYRYIENNKDKTINFANLGLVVSQASDYSNEAFGDAIGKRGFKGEEAGKGSINRNFELERVEIDPDIRTSKEPFSRIEYTYFNEEESTASKAENHTDFDLWTSTDNRQIWRKNNVASAGGIVETEKVAYFDNDAGIPLSTGSTNVLTVGVKDCGEQFIGGAYSSLTVKGVCEGNAVTIGVTEEEYSGYEYNWYMKDVATGNFERIEGVGNVTTIDTGEGEYKAIVFNAQGCEQQIEFKVETKEAPSVFNRDGGIENQIQITSSEGYIPEGSTTPPIFMAGQTVNLSAYLVDANTDKSDFEYFWDYGDGTTSEIFSISPSASIQTSYQYLNTGTYTQKLIVSNKKYGCVTSIDQKLKVIIPPTVTFQNSTLSLCENELLMVTPQIDDTSVTEGGLGLAPDSFVWEKNTGTVEAPVWSIQSSLNADSKVLELEDLSTGIHIFRLKIQRTIEDGKLLYEVISAPIIVTYYPVPIIEDLLFDQTQLTAGSTLEFSPSIRYSSSLSELNYTWTTSHISGEQKNTEKVTYQFDQAGTYAITLEISTSQGCRYDFTKEFTIYPSIEAITISPNGRVFCANTKISFANTVPLTPLEGAFEGADYQFEWFVDEVELGSTEKFDYTPASVGSKTVKLRLSIVKGEQVLGYKETTATAQIEANGSASYTSNQSKESICYGEIIEYTINNFDPANTYYWLVNDEEKKVTNKESTFSYTFDKKGTYEVSLYYSSAAQCNSSAYSTTVNVEPLIQLPLQSNSISICGTSYTLDLSLLGTLSIPENSVIEWYKGPNDTGEVIGTNTQLEVTSSGVYKVKITSPSGCEAQSSYHVQLHPALDVDLGADRIIFSSTTLQSNVSGQEYKWYKDDTFISGNTTIQVNETGVYKLEVIYNGCTWTDEVALTYVTSSPVSLPHQYQLCDKITLVPTVEGAQPYTYLWNTGAVTETIEVNKTGIYTLTASNTITGQQFHLQTEVIALPPITPNVTLNYTCASEGVQIENNTVYSSPLSFTYKEGDDWKEVDSNTPLQLEAGTHQLHFKFTNTYGCSEELMQEVTIEDCPSLALQINEGCIGETTQFSVQGITAALKNVSYQWDLGDGTRSQQENLEYAYLQSGNYDVQLIVLAEIGNQTKTYTLQQQVQIHEDLTPQWAPSLSLCADNYTLNAPEGGTSYEWLNVTTNTTLSETNHQLKVTTSGTYRVTVMNEQCNFTKEIALQLNSELKPSLGEDRVFCDKTELEAGYEGYEYLWSNGATTPSIAVGTSGLYWVEVTDPVNGCSGRDTVNLTLLRTPQVDLGADRKLCFGETATLDVGLSGYNYLWNTGETTRRIEASTSGLYSVEVSKEGNKCATTAYVYVEVLPQTTVDFVYQDVCLGEAIQFSTTSTDQLYWDFGDGTNSSIASPSKTYKKEGTYTVSLTATSENGCVASQFHQVKVYKRPEVDFEFKVSCDSYQVNFQEIKDPNSVVTFAWDFGDGHTYLGTQPSHQYSTSGNYTVTLTPLTLSGCDGETIEKTIQIQPEITALLPSTLTVCAEEYTFDLSGTPYVILWENYLTTPQRTVTQTGTYSVQLTDPVSGCSSTQQVELILHRPPVITFPETLEGCSQVHITSGVSNMTYFWSTGENTSDITVTESGTYTLMVVDENGCSASQSVEVTVHTPPALQLPASINACREERVELDPKGDSNLSYLWSDGSRASSLIVYCSGDYSVTATDQYGCTSTAQVNVQFNEVPQLDLPTYLSGCGSVIIDPNYYVGDFLWSTGETDKFITVTETGDYSVTVTSPGGCEVQQTVRVEIVPTPSLDLGPDHQICFGISTILDAGEGTDYYWSNGTTARYLEVSETGQYWVNVTTANGCTIRDEVFIEVGDDIHPRLGGDQLLCQDGSILQTTVPEKEGRTFEWSSEKGVLSDQTYLEVNEAGKYWLTIRDASGCSSTDTVEMLMTDKQMVAKFLVSTVVHQGEPVQFVQVSYDDPQSFFWQFGDGATSEEENPVYRYFQTGDYTVTMSTDNGICDAVTSKVITVIDPNEIDNARQPDNEEEGDAPKLVELLEIQTAKVYPNPTSSYATLAIGLSVPARVEWRLLDLQGKEYRHKVIHALNAEQLIDLQGMPIGVYIIHIITGQTSKTLKLIKK